jgi:hypothetical protein
MQNKITFAGVLLLSFLSFGFFGECGGGSSSSGTIYTFMEPTILFSQFEGSGSTAIDSSGNDLHATIEGCGRVPGKVGKGLEILPGGYVTYDFITDSSISMHDPFMDTGAISIEAWIKMTTVQPGETYHIFGGGYDGVRFQVNDQKIEFLYDFDGWSTVVAGNSSLVADTWYYVTVTYDNTEAHIYVNGVEDNYRNVIYPFPYWNNRWYIGNQHSTGTGSNDFPGIIDELRVSNIKLSSIEIVNYYESTK